MKSDERQDLLLTKWIYIFGEIKISITHFL